jgi:hypothetical protein
MMSGLRVAAAAALVVAGIALPGCTEVEEETAEGYEPAKLQEVEGSELKQVTFTAEGAARTGLHTESVERSGGQLAVPYSALIYDGDGRAYVYVRPKPLSFVRAPVAIDRIEGATVLLRDGPPVGSRVVTTGAAEVYGTELEVAGSH